MRERLCLEQRPTDATAVQAARVFPARWCGNGRTTGRGRCVSPCSSYLICNALALLMPPAVKIFTGSLPFFSFAGMRTTIFVVDHER